MQTRLNTTQIPYHIDLVLDSIGEGAIIAGGAARELVVPDAPPAGDIDVFVLTGTDPAAVCDRLEMSGFKESREPRPGVRTFTAAFVPVPVQVVWNPEQPWATPNGVISTFGFTTEQFALYRKGDETWAEYSAYAVPDTRNRVLLVNNILDPVRLLWRINKYGRKGYTIDLAAVQEIADAYARLNPQEQRAIREGTFKLGTPSDPEGQGDFVA